MRGFLAGLRRVLAYTDFNRLNIGSVVHQFIREDIIPRLQKKLEAAKTDNEKDMLERLIAEYEKYSDPRDPASTIYTKTAANLVRQLALRSGMGDEDMEDLTQQLALDFNTTLPQQAEWRKLERGEEPSKSIPGGNTLADYMRGVDIMGGPLNVNKMWMRNVKFRTQWRIQELKSRHEERTRAPTGDEGEERDSWSLVEAPSQIDESYVTQVIADLTDFIHRKFSSSPEKKDLFDVWFEAAQEKGFDKVDMKHDVYNTLKDKGYGGSLTGSMPLWWNEIKRAIVQFFEKETEGAVSNQIRKMLKVSSAEVVAYSVFRRRLAAWMLSGILRSTIERV